MRTVPPRSGRRRCGGSRPRSGPATSSRPRALAQVPEGAKLRVEEPPVGPDDHPVGQPGEPVADLARLRPAPLRPVEEPSDLRGQDADDPGAGLDVVPPARVPEVEEHLSRLVLHLLKLGALEDQVVRELLVEERLPQGLRVDDELEAVPVRQPRHEIVALADPAGRDEGADPRREDPLEPVRTDRVQELVHEPQARRVRDVARRPPLDPVNREEARLHAVDDVVERIRRVVGPVHDLALDALESVQLLARAKAPRDPRSAEHKIEDVPLGVVEEVVLRRPAELPEARLVLEDAVQKRAGRLHAADPGGSLVHGRDQEVQRLGVPLKPAPAPHELLERPLAGMPERRMAQVVREAHRLDQVGVDMEVVPERAVQRPQVVADRAPDLGHLHRVRQARPVEVVFPR